MSRSLAALSERDSRQCISMLFYPFWQNMQAQYIVDMGGVSNLVIQL